MAEEPFVSVVIPTFNRAHFLSEAIKSVLEQVYKNWELIIVDDNSTDETENVVTEFIKRNDNIRLIKNARNIKGPGAARNTGIEASKGKYIAFLDSDDWWENEHLKDCISILEKDKKIGIVFSECRYLNNEKVINESFFKETTILNEIPFEIFNYNPLCRRFTENIFGYLLKEYLIPIQSSVFRKELLDKYRFSEDIQIGEDRHLVIRISKEEEIDICFLGKVGCNILCHGGNIANENKDIPKTFNESLKVWIDLKSRYRYEISKKERRQINFNISNTYFGIGYYYFKEKNMFNLARDYYLKSLIYRFNFKLLKSFLISCFLPKNWIVRHFDKKYNRNR